MKLFSKLLLTLTIIASSVFAEPAKELQEELACAFIHGDMAGIKTNLDAGANPFTIHKTEHILYFMKDVLKLEEHEIEFIESQDEVSPFIVMSRSFEDRAQKNIMASLEAILKYGVSVDNGINGYFSPRYQIDRGLSETESKAEQDKQYAQPAEQLKNLLALMRKYQPEPAGFEYASSFRFVPNVCTECDLEKKAAEIETTLKTYRVLSVYGALACYYMLYGCLKNGYTAGKIGFTEGLTKSFFSHAASSIAHYMNGTVLAFGVLHLINQRQEIWRKLISKIHPH